MLVCCGNGAKMSYLLEKQELKIEASPFALQRSVPGIAAVNAAGPNRPLF